MPPRRPARNVRRSMALTSDLLPTREARFGSEGA
jgi:hypothetical protein